MKKIVYVITTILFLMTLLVAGTANAGTLSVTIKGSSTIAVPERSTTEKSEVVKEIPIIVPRYHPDSPGSDTKIEEDNGGYPVDMSTPKIEEDNGGYYAEVAPNIVEDNGGYYAEVSLFCGESEHQNLPYGERFVLTRNGQFFLDRKTCLEWYTLGWKWNQGVNDLGLVWTGDMVTYDAAYYACELLGPDDSQGEWYMPKIEDLESLTVAGKEDPAVPDDFPDGMLQGAYGCNWGHIDNDDSYWNYGHGCGVWSGSTNGIESFWDSSMTKVMYMTDGAEAHIYTGNDIEGALEQVWCVNGDSYKYLEH